MFILETTVKNTRKRHVRGYEEGEYVYPIIDEVIMHNDLEKRVLEIFRKFKGGIFSNDVEIINILSNHYESYNIE